MAKRELGIERVFNLGPYKSLRVKESVEVDDDNYTDDEISGLRMLLLLSAYELFGMNKLLMSLMVEAQKSNDGVALTGQQILDTVLEVRAQVLHELEVEDA